MGLLIENTQIFDDHIIDFNMGTTDGNLKFDEIYYVSPISSHILYLYVAHISSSPYLVLLLPLTTPNTNSQTEAVLTAPV